MLYTFKSTNLLDDNVIPLVINEKMFLIFLKRMVYVYVLLKVISLIFADFVI